MGETESFPCVQKYHLLKVTKNIFTVSDCLKLASDIEHAINMGKHFVVLEFQPQVSLAASLPGFLLNCIRKIHMLNGEIILVAPSESQQEIFSLAQFHFAVPVVQSLDAVTA